MKREDYFRDPAFEEALRDLLQIPKNPRPLDPARAALLILDMQDYFLDPASHAFVPSAKNIRSGLLDLQTVFQDRNLPVILTRHLNRPGQAPNMEKWWRDIIRPDHPLSRLAPPFGQEGTRVITKSQYDAFFQTGLENELKNGRISQLVIGGVMTHLCCDTTARSAFMRGFEVFFLADGTATYHRDFHLAALRSLAHGFCVLTTCRRIREQVEVF